MLAKKCNLAFSKDKVIRCLKKVFLAELPVSEPIIVWAEIEVILKLPQKISFEAFNQGFNKKNKLQKDTVLICI